MIGFYIGLFSGLGIALICTFTIKVSTILNIATEKELIVALKNKQLSKRLQEETNREIMENDYRFY